MLHSYLMIMLLLHAKKSSPLPAGSHACNLSLEIMLTWEFYSGALPLVLRAWRCIRGDRVM